MSALAAAAWTRQVTDGSLRAQVGTITFQRGRDYAQRGFVTALAAHGERNVLLGTVSGSRSHAYQVVITPDRIGPGIIPHWSGSCSCPMGWNCKHCVAVVLTARARVGSPTSTRPVVPGWERALASFAAPSGSEDQKPVPELALELNVVASGPQRYAGGGNQPRLLHVRPLRQGARGRWVKTGASWADLERYGADRQYRADQVRVLTELLQLHRLAVASSVYSWGPPEVFLDGLNGQVWPLLQRVRDTGIALLSTDERRVSVEPSPLTVTADLDRDRGLRLQVQVIDGDGQPVTDEVLVLGEPVHGVAVRTETALRLHPLTGPVPREIVELLLAGKVLTVPAADQERFLSGYYPGLRRAIPVTARSGRVELPELGRPNLVLRVSFGAEHVAQLSWLFRYRVGSTSTEIPVGSAAPNPVRDHRAERVALDALSETDMLTPCPALLSTDAAGRVDVVPALVLAGMDTARFAQTVLPALQSTSAVEVELTGQLLDYQPATAEPVVELAVRDRADDSDWFDLSVAVSVDQQDVPLADLITGPTLGQDHLLLRSGTYFPLTSPSLDQLRKLLAEARDLTDPVSGSMRVSLYQAGLWEQLVALGVVAEQSAAWQQRVGALLSGPGAGTSPATPPAVPDTVQATLRPYQAEGFGWLRVLWQAGLGGVLADDMGLGKTLQTLSAIAAARKDDASDPVLVVAPTSVVSTWVSEAARFAPGLRVVAITETGRRRAASSVAALAADADVVVTSYTLVRLDEAEYRAVAWQALILDEAQFVKNYRAKTYQCVRRLQRSVTLAMTGTPLENSVMDLWAILSLTCPGLFPSPEHFIQEYRKPIEAGTGAAQLESLRRRIRPFVLRRTKNEVEADLPAKTEQTLMVPMSPTHRRSYDRLLQRERQRVLGLLEDLPRNRVAVLAALTTLRQAALDPALVDPTYQAATPPAKIDLLVEHLHELTSEGHRALVFSQFTRFLHRVRTRLSEEGIDSVYLDGRTKDRAAVVASFREGSAPAFLISLKAGGFGLTLTEADYVYVLDPWWNPAAESQAIDRAHRIGQTKPVMVYRLVSQDSIEGKVVALQERKRDLFGSVVEAAGLSAAIGANELRELLSS